MDSPRQNDVCVLPLHHPTGKVQEGDEGKVIVEGIDLSEAMLQFQILLLQQFTPLHLREGFHHIFQGKVGLLGYGGWMVEVFLSSMEIEQDFKSAGESQGGEQLPTLLRGGEITLKPFGWFRHQQVEGKIPGQHSQKQTLLGVDIGAQPGAGGECRDNALHIAGVP